jgi:hypothetical protein
LFTNQKNKIMRQMKVTRTIDKEVLGLGQKIKQAREADRRTLEAICTLRKIKLASEIGLIGFVVGVTAGEML